jgi:CRISPR type III-B/RAMP module RAMP protein Cmr6
MSLVTATKEVCRALGGSGFPKLESPSLRLEKFLCLEENGKRREIEAVVNCHGRHARAAQTFRPRNARTLVMKLGGRLIVNQAGGVLENAGLCLHRHFGYPSIPGSAVKGAARHAAWCEWEEAEGPEKRELARRIAFTFGFPTRASELDAYLRAEFSELFGEGASHAMNAGCVAFLAATPQGKGKLGVDIVNCHHREYYAGKRNRATDDEDPNLQYFPVVEAGSSFEFVFCPTRRAAMLDYDALAAAERWLRAAAEIHGMGAKTAAGYGWFEFDEAAAAAAQLAGARKRQAEEDAKRLAGMSPEDRRVDELGRLDQETFKKDCINPLATFEEEEQHAILRALVEKHPGIWEKDRQEKPKKKGGKRALQVRAVAAKLGVDLP